MPLPGRPRLLAVEGREDDRARARGLGGQHARELRAARRRRPRRRRRPARPGAVSWCAADRARTRRPGPRSVPTTFVPWMPCRSKRCSSTSAARPRASARPRTAPRPRCASSPTGAARARPGPRRGAARRSPSIEAASRSGSRSAIARRIIRAARRRWRAARGVLLDSRYPATGGGPMRSKAFARALALACRSLRGRRSPRRARCAARVQLARQERPRPRPTSRTRSSGSRARRPQPRPASATRRDEGQGVRAARGGGARRRQRRVPERGPRVPQRVLGLGREPLRPRPLQEAEERRPDLPAPGARARLLQHPPADERVRAGAGQPVLGARRRRRDVRDRGRAGRQLDAARPGTSAAARRRAAVDGRRRGQAQALALALDASRFKRAPHKNKFGKDYDAGASTEPEDARCG